MRQVRQKHDWDCSIAAVASATDHTYGEVREELKPKKVGKSLSTFQIMELPTYLGYSVAPKWQYSQANFEKREPWPPSPFAPTHIALVVVGDKTHYVAWDGDEIMCPAGQAEEGLEDYKEVRVVVGLYEQGRLLYDYFNNPESEDD